MVKAIITIGDREDRVLNIVKGKYGLKNKSDAICLIIDKFEEGYLEPELRPEYFDRFLKLERGKKKKYSNIADLRKDIEGV